MRHQNSRHSFEQLEMESRRKEFHFLERRLASLQYELDDLREEIAEFEKVYAEEMSERIAELESLEKELGKFATQHAGAGSQERRDYSRRSHGQKQADDAAPEPMQREPRPRSEESLKEMYRKVAKAIHPDLSRHEHERTRRQHLMAEANRAYAEEDHLTLCSILQEWDVERDPSRERISERALVEQRVAHLKERIRAAEGEIARMKGSDLYRLVQQVQQARNLGKNVLGEMAAKLEHDILNACRKLNTVKQSHNQDAPAGCGFRTVTFLRDRSLGQVYVRNSLSRNFLDWRRLGDAVGAVAVPSGFSLRLDVDQGRAIDLALLTGLAANDLHGCYLYGATNGDITNVLRFRTIEELYLSGPGVTAEGMIHLLELSCIERLYLYDTLIGDEGLVYLKYLKRLRCVTFCNSGISDHGIDRLRAALPFCTVINLPVPRTNRQ